LRIIAGTAKGRKLFSPKGNSIRPTADRARQALFNILAERIVDSTVVDLFAGTGAFGIEALSRGAASALFVDQSTVALQLVRKNLDLCGLSDSATIIRRDLSRGLSFLDGSFDCIFCDPPYGKGLAGGVLVETEHQEILKQNGLLILEERSGVALPQNQGDLTLFDQRRYGDTNFWFYSRYNEQ